MLNRRGFCSWCPSKFFLSKNLFFANPVQNVSVLRLPSETSGFCSAHTSTLTSLFAIFLKIWIVIWDGRNTKLSGPENKQEIHQASAELSLGPHVHAFTWGQSPLCSRPLLGHQERPQCSLLALCSYYSLCVHGKETFCPDIFCSHFWYLDKVLCIDRIMCCKERKFIQIHAV